MFLSQKITFQSDHYREDAKEALSLFLPSASIEIGENGSISAKKCFGDEEKHEIEVCDGCLKIRHGSYKSLVNALSVIASSVTLENGKYTLELFHVPSRPQASHRGVMIDLARGVKPFDEFMQDLVLIAKCRYNVVHLHLFDSKGCCVKIKSLPEALWLEGSYTLEQLSVILERARILGLEVIPEFDMPGHSTRLLRTLPHFTCKDRDGNDFDWRWTVCAGLEEVYDFYRNIINELAALFPGKYLHIGTDELEMTDLPNSHHICYWNECEACRQYREKHGIADRQEYFYHFVLRIYDMVKAAGKEMVMWSDQIDCMRPCPLPRDILMHFWRVAAPGRGPYEGCSMNAQLKMGYKVVNSYYPQTYTITPEHVTEETVAAWDFRSIPECDEDVKDRVLGGEFCVWEYGNTANYPHYLRSFPTALILYGDKFWGGAEKLVYTEAYKQKNTRVILGECAPKGCDVLTHLGSVIAPLTGAMYHEGKEVKEGIEETISQLEYVIQNGSPADVKHARLFMENLKCIQKGIPFAEPIHQQETII